MWDETIGSYDLNRLPPTTSKELFEFYRQQNEKDGGIFSSNSMMGEEQNLLPKRIDDDAFSSSAASLSSPTAGYDWFQLLSNLPGCIYLATSPNGKQYELAPTVSNVSSVIRYLLFDNKSGDDNALAVDPTNTNDMKKQGEFEEDTNETKPSSFIKLVSEIRSMSPGHIEFHVSADTLTHRSFATGKSIKHDIATLQSELSHHAIELRMRCDMEDKSGMAIVSHLRRKQKHDIKTSQIVDVLLRAHTNGNVEFDISLNILSLGLIGDASASSNRTEQISIWGMTQNSSSRSLIAELLSTPIGCDRRILKPVVGNDDEDDGAEPFAEKVQEESNLVTTTAVKKICEISKSDPGLAAPLLCWILTDSPRVSDLHHRTLSREENWDDIYESISSSPRSL